MADPFRFTGPHADHLGSGRPLAPGDEVPADAVDRENPKDQQLLDDGHLLPIPPESLAEERRRQAELEAEQKADDEAAQEAAEAQQKADDEAAKQAAAAAEQKAAAEARKAAGRKSAGGEEPNNGGGEA